MHQQMVHQHNMLIMQTPKLCNLATSDLTNAMEGSITTQFTKKARARRCLKIKDTGSLLPILKIVQSPQMTLNSCQIQIGNGLRKQGLCTKGQVTTNLHPVTLRTSISSRCSRRSHMEINNSYLVQRLTKGQINGLQLLCKNKASQAVAVKVEVIAAAKVEKSRRQLITLKVAKITAWMAAGRNPSRLLLYLSGPRKKLRLKLKNLTRMQRMFSNSTRTFFKFGIRSRCPCSIEWLSSSRSRC